MQTCTEKVDSVTRVSGDAWITVYCLSCPTLLYWFSLLPCAFFLVHSCDQKYHAIYSNKIQNTTLMLVKSSIILQLDIELSFLKRMI